MINTHSLYVANAAQIQEIDRIMIEEYCFPSLLLMETAGRKAAEFIDSAYPGVPLFFIACGIGNNGGDGFVIARYLANYNRRVVVMLAEEPGLLKDDALLNFRILEKRGLEYFIFHPEHTPSQIQFLLEHGGVIIDALMGTGLRAKFREPYASIVQTLNAFKVPVVAIDMPSGLLGDTGALVNIPLRCEYTVTFQLPKICLFVTPAANYAGRVIIQSLDIYPNIIERLGIKTQLITDDLVRSWYQPRTQTDVHKGTFGHVLSIGGSTQMAGAIALTAQAALEIGAGLSTAFIPGSANAAFHAASLECMTIPYGTENTTHLDAGAAALAGATLVKKNVIALGPGLGTNELTAEFLEQFLPYVNLPLVLDADALNSLAHYPELRNLITPKVLAESVITPHPGEMARLLKTTPEAIQEKRYESIIKLALDWKVTVVLKGAATLIASPTGQVYICPIGNPGMATAGAGDVLTGIIAGLMAQGYKSTVAAVMGVYLHAKAGDLAAEQHGFEGVSASKISACVGQALKQVIR